MRDEFTIPIDEPQPSRLCLNGRTHIVLDVGLARDRAVRRTELRLGTHDQLDGVPVLIEGMPRVPRGALGCD